MVRILTWVSEFCDTKIIVESHTIYKITYLTLLVSTSSTSSSEENIPDPGILCTNGTAEFKYYLYLHLPQIYHTRQWKNIASFFQTLNEIILSIQKSWDGGKDIADILEARKVIDMKKERPLREQSKESDEKMKAFEQESLDVA